LTNEAKAAQRQFWNSDFGAKWVAFEADLETLHAPMNGPLLARAAIGPEVQVLDVGCGSGSVARRAAALAGAVGAVISVDISEVLLDTARATAADEMSSSIEYVLADAQTHAFAPASFDRIVSRMGVMFFADPVAAFANLLHAARPGAALSAVVWRRKEANPWFQIPTEAAIRHVGPVESDPDAPGPLAFANVDRTLAVLEAANWEDVRADPLQVILETRGTAKEAAASVGSIGPAARIMEAKDATAAQVAAIATDIAAFCQGVRVSGRRRLSQRRSIRYFGEFPYSAPTRLLDPASSAPSLQVSRQQRGRPIAAGRHANAQSNRRWGFLRLVLNALPKSLADRPNTLERGSDFCLNRARGSYRGGIATRRTRMPDGCPDRTQPHRRP